MKKLISLILALILTLLAVVSCTGNGDQQVTDDETTTSWEERPDVENTDKILLCDTKNVYYKVIRPTLYDDNIMECMQSVVNKIRELSGLSIIPAEDWVRPGTDTSETLEILIGNTNRDASAEAMGKTSYDGYSISVSGNKIVIAAHDKENLKKAVGYFCDNCIKVEKMDDGVAVYYEGSDMFKNTETEFVFGAGNPISEYTIVCNKSIRENYTVATKVVNAVKKNFGVELKINDQSDPETDKEIVVGETTRSISKEALDGIDDIEAIIISKGNKLFIGGKNYTMTQIAADEFFENYANKMYSDQPVLKCGEQIKVSMKFNDSPTLAEGADARIMSFNLLCELWNDKLPVAGRDKTVLGILNYYLPDVAGIQEVSDMWYASFDKLLGTRYAFTDRRNSAGQTNFSTLIYNTEKVKLIEHGVINYSKGNDPKLRLVTWGLFENLKSGKRYIVMTTHWDLGKNAEYQKIHSDEMAAIANDLKAKYNVPIVTTGDYNVNEQSIYYSNFLEKTGFSDSKYTAEKVNRACKTTHTVGTPPSSANAICIDHIFGSSDAKFLYFNVLIDQVIAEASDHSPIYADVKFIN